MFIKRFNITVIFHRVILTNIHWVSLIISVLISNVSVMFFSLSLQHMVQPNIGLHRSKNCIIIISLVHPGKWVNPSWVLGSTRLKIFLISFSFENVVIIFTEINFRRAFCFSIGVSNFNIWIKLSDNLIIISSFISPGKRVGPSKEFGSTGAIVIILFSIGNIIVIFT